MRLLLAAAVALGLVACGKKGNPVRPDGSAAVIATPQDEFDSEQTGEIEFGDPIE